MKGLRLQASGLRNVAALVFVLAVAAPAFAQGGSPLAIRGAATIGYEHFMASQTFKAILDAPGGPVYGGGVEVIFRRHLFFRVEGTRFKKTGERAFDLNGQVFKLGIPLTITVTPVIGSAGYRADLSRHLAWYIGGGVGSWSYSETSDDPTENVAFRTTGFAGLGGVEWRLQRWVGLGFEGQLTSVPNAIGKAGISADFNEKNLGGMTGAIRIVIGQQ